MTRVDSLSDVRQFRAWSGSLEDVRTVGQAIEDQFEDERNRALEKAKWSIRRARLRNRLRFRPKDDLEKGLEGFGRVHLSARNGRDEVVTDRFDRLIEDAEIDLTDMSSLSFYCEVEEQKCSVLLSDDVFGCRMSVQGSTRWVPGTARAVRNELNADRPWWAFLRHPAAYISVGVVLTIGAFAGLVGLGNVINPNDKWPAGAATAYWFVGWLLIFFAGWLCLRLANVLFPQMEIRSDRPNARNRLKRAVVTVSALILGTVTLWQGIAWSMDHI